jgi:ubiquinone biosynthesis protein
VRNISQLFHLLFISRVLLRHGLDELILNTHLFRPLRLIRFISPTFWLKHRTKKPRGVRIREALEDLGPIFVKFGQILSTRRDLLPDDLAEELAKLQDQVPPFPGEQAVKIIEDAFKQPVSEVFAEFDETPMASASIAQIHKATMHDGREMVVKVVRPDIEKVIRRDLSLLYAIAEKIEKYWADGKRLRPVEIVAEFEKNIIDELDLFREAANASQLRRNFLNSPLLYVPEVDWDHCRKKVMVMERIHGMPVTNMQELKAQDLNFKLLAEMGVEIFFTQVFRDNFFHADMHPGNIFISNSGQYIAIDFGIMGSLSQEDQRYLAENFLAFFNRDYYRVAELHVLSGWVPADTRIDDFESAIRSVCEPIFEKPLHEISFGQLLLRLFQTARRYNMEVQPQLVLLQKTLLNIEGLGRELYPQLDLWVTAKPFLENWMKEQLGLKSFVRQIKHNAPLWIEQLPEFPNKLFDVVQQARQGKLSINYKSETLERIENRIELQGKNTVQAMVSAALLIAGAILYTGQYFIEAQVLAGLGFAGGIWAFLRQT